MTITQIKAPSGTPNDAPTDVSARVRELLADVRSRGEEGAIELACTFDGWDGPIVVDEAAVRAARSELAPSVLDDIKEAHRNIRDFALAQRATLRPFEVEVAPGMRAGHRLVPVNVSGCYVPAGRFAHIPVCQAEVRHR